MLLLVALTATLAIASATDRTTCRRNDQCGAGECCYYHEGPLIMSKRVALPQRVDIMNMHQGGWCEPYKMEGESCSVFGKINGHCECNVGLTCHFVAAPAVLSPGKDVLPVAINNKRSMVFMGPGSYRCVNPDSLVTSKMP